MALFKSKSKQAVKSTVATKTKKVDLFGRTKERIDALQVELDSILKQLNQQASDAQATYANRMTDVVVGYLDGQGIDIDLSKDQITREGDTLVIKYSTTSPPNTAENPAPETPQEIEK